MHKVVVEQDIKQDWVDALIDRLDSETARFPDFKINDGDFKQSPNFLQFIIDYQRLGDQPFVPWAKQIQVASHYFSEICWNPKCTNVDFAEEFPVDATVDDILDNVTFLNYGVCPHCGMTKFDFWQEGIGGGPYFELVGVCGQRASKSYLTALMVLYYLQTYIKLGNPRRAFGLGSVTLHFVFTGNTYMQAKQNLFDYLCNHMEDNIWFQQYNEFLTGIAHDRGLDPESLFRIMDTAVVYGHRHIMLQPQAPDTRNQRGYTRVGWLIDELGHMGALDGKNAVKLNPDGVYAALSNSMANVIDGVVAIFDAGKDLSVLSPVTGSVSSPKSFDDKICRLLRQAQDADEEDEDSSFGTLAFHYPTWEFNPKLKEDCLFLRRQRKQLGEADFMRDFGAVPPKAANAFITDSSLLVNSVNKKYRNPLVLKFDKEPSISDEGFLKTAVLHKRGNIATHKKVLAIDAGHTKNSFAGCVAHMDDDTGQMIIDGLFEIIPERDAPISFASARADVIDKLLDEWNIGVLAADRWNSLSLLQETEAYYDDVKAVQYSLKYSDFVAFRAGLTEGDIVWPKAEMTLDQAFAFPLSQYPLCFEGMPVIHSLLQAVTVEDILARKVDKGGARTDDLFRAIVLAHYCLNNADLAQYLEGGGTAPVTSSTLAVYASNGSASFTQSSIETPAVTAIVISGTR